MHRPKYAEPSWFGGEISISGSTSSLQWDAAFTHNTSRGAAGGLGRVTDEFGNVTEWRDILVHNEGEYPGLSGNLSWSAAGGTVVNLNALYESTHQDNTNDELRDPITGFDQFRDFDSSNRGHQHELGTDIDFEFGPGRLKLIGLSSYEYSNEQADSVLIFENGNPDTGNRFLRQSASREKIFRSEYRWNSNSANWQFDTEAAFNELNQSSRLFELDNSGMLVQVPFPAGTGGVSEDRYEMTLTHGRTFENGLSLQLVLGAENSEFAQSGPGGLVRNFWRPKGSLALAFSPAQGLNVSLNLERKVGQLSFSDFLAEVFLDEKFANAGNSQLKPTLSWESELEIKKDLDIWGSTTFKLYSRWFDDYIDVIPLTGGGESPGNIESATLLGLNWDSTVNLNPLGWDGAKLDLDFTVEKSEVRDPLTGQNRAFSNHFDRKADISLRHDLVGSDWAWGLGLEYRHRLPAYRLYEISRIYEGPIYSFAFIEHKDVFGLTAKVQVYNMTDGRTHIDRIIYDGERNTSPILYIEDHDLSVQPIFRLELTGSF